MSSTARSASSTRSTHDLPSSNSSQSNFWNFSLHLHCCCSAQESGFYAISAHQEESTPRTHPNASTFEENNISLRSSIRLNRLVAGPENQHTCLDVKQQKYLQKPPMLIHQNPRLTQQNQESTVDLTKNFASNKVDSQLTNKPLTSSHESSARKQQMLPHHTPARGVRKEIKKLNSLSNNLTRSITNDSGSPKKSRNAAKISIISKGVQQIRQIPCRRLNY